MTALVWPVAVVWTDNGPVLSLGGRPTRMIWYSAPVESLITRQAVRLLVGKETASISAVSWTGFGPTA